MKKKQTKKKYDSSNGKRQEWKNETENEIIMLQEDIDELELPKQTVLDIEKLINKFKERLNDAIELFAVTPEIANQTEDFTENFLDEIYFDRIVIGESDIRRMIDIVESTRTGNGGIFIKIDSLSEQLKVESFLADLQENPYQLKLIA